jgi:hypothetical protein
MACNWDSVTLLLLYQLYKRLGGPQSRSGCCGEVKILDPTGNRTPTPRSPSPYPVAIPAQQHAHKNINIKYNSHFQQIIMQFKLTCFGDFNWTSSELYFLNSERNLCKVLFCKDIMLIWDGIAHSVQRRAGLPYFVSRQRQVISLHSSSEAHPTPYPTDVCCWQGRESDHSYLCRPEVKNGGATPPLYHTSS